MNVLEAKVERRDDGLSLAAGATVLPIPAETLSARPRLSEYAGRTIAVGIRPEALDSANGRNGDGGARGRGVVRAIEALGPEQLVHV